VSGLAGDQSVRTGDASQGLDRIFDREGVTQDVTAQATVMAEFGKQASQLIGDVADTKLKESLDLRSKALQAREQGDAARADALDAQAQALDAAWGDQGTMRLLAHTVVGGLTGNVAGAAGAAASTAGSPLLLDALANAGLDPDLARGLTALASTALGAAVGGGTGAMTAFNEVSNNFLNHQQQRQYAQALTACRTDTDCQRRVHDQYQSLSNQNNQALAKAQAQCDKTGQCDERDRLYASGVAWGDGLKQVQAATDPEAALVNPVLERVNAKQVQALINRPLQQEVVRLGPVTSFDAQGNVSIDPPRFVAAVDNRNAVTSMGVALAPTLLLPGPEDLVVGAALATKAGQKIAEVVMQGGQKVWRFVDGSTARVGSQEAEQIARARVDVAARTDDAQQYDHFRRPESTRVGGEWDWQKQAPNSGAVPGTQQTVVVPAGQTLDRYGNRGGEYMSPVGTPYEARALPPGKIADPYEQYQVLKPFTVDKEKIAPAFDQPGHGVQMRAKIPEVANGYATINDLIKYGYLKDPKK